MRNLFVNNKKQEVMCMCIGKIRYTGLCLG